MNIGAWVLILVSVIGLILHWGWESWIQKETFGFITIYIKEYMWICLILFQASSLKKVYATFSVFLWFFYHFRIYCCNSNILNFKHIYTLTHIYMITYFSSLSPYAISFSLLLSLSLHYFCDLNVLILPGEEELSQGSASWKVMVVIHSCLFKHPVSTTRISFNLLTETKLWIKIMLFLCSLGHTQSLFQGLLNL